MPTYDYACQDCGHEMEAFHSMSTPALTDCPKCGKSALRKKIGRGAGLLFKGSGFYTTDYRSDGYKKAAKSEGSSAPAAAAADKPAAASSEKPASKAPTPAS
jgi:putative FmdB family regulatory protein